MKEEESFEFWFESFLEAFLKANGREPTHREVAIAAIEARAEKIKEKPDDG